MEKSVYHNQEVFVIVPCYNEEQAVIDEVISQLLESEYQVVLVDDGSDKKVKATLRKKSLHIIRHKINLGQGAALETGKQYALQHNAAFIVHFDADGQHAVTDIPHLLDTLVRDDIQIVFGSRFMTKKAKNLSAQKRIVLQIARYINFLFTGILLSDAHNGFRAFRGDCAKALTLTENRMAHATEILALVKKNNLLFQEVPVQINYTRYSIQKGQSVWNGVKIFFDLILNKLFQ